MPRRNRADWEHRLLQDQYYETVWRCLSYDWALHFVERKGRIRTGEASRFTYRRTALDAALSFEKHLTMRLKAAGVDPRAVKQLRGVKTRPRPPFVEHTLSVMDDEVLPPPGLRGDPT